MGEASERYSTSKKDGSVDFDYFIKNDIPTSYIVELLKHQGVSQSEIEKTVSRVKDLRKKVDKTVRDFMSKVNRKYAHADAGTILKKGLKYAQKYKLTPVEVEIFKKRVLGSHKEVFNKNMRPDDELRFSDMSKFLGMSSHDEPKFQLFKLEGKDMAKLNELFVLYQNHRAITKDVREMVWTYESCATSALLAKFDDAKNIASVHINPVMYMLFLPKIKFLEERMLLTNIGRMILSRTELYVTNKDQISPATLQENQFEVDFMFDLSRDPNTDGYFNKDSPFSNLIKRYEIQLALYRNVLALRQGRPYGTSYTDVNGDVMGLTTALSKFDLVMHDSPEMINVDDSAAFLRKLFSVFSIRPTLVQLSGTDVGYYQPPLAGAPPAYANLQKMSFMNIPIIPIRIRDPSTVQSLNLGVRQISVRQSINQQMYVIEKKKMVLKNRTIMNSKHIVLFSIDRKYNSTAFYNQQYNQQYQYIPIASSMSSVTKLNTERLFVDNSLNIGSQTFKNISAVVYNKPVIPDIADVGTHALVRSDILNSLTGNNYIFNYNPLAVTNYVPPPAGATSKPERAQAITFIDNAEYSSEVSERGILLLYAI